MAVGPLRIIKEEDLLLITDESGDIRPELRHWTGLYMADTRFLSRCDLRIEHRRPVLLASSPETEFESTFLLTNNQILRNGYDEIPARTLGVRRRYLIEASVLHEVELTNFHVSALDVLVEIGFDADFVDLFEIRGLTRRKRGHRQADESRRDQLVFSYVGLDGIKRETRIRFRGEPQSIARGTASYLLSLESGERVALQCEIEAIVERPPEAAVDPRRRDRKETTRRSYVSWARGCTEITTDSEFMNRLLDRSARDLRNLITDQAEGIFPMAGLPRFNVPFGRDGIITALQTLALNPDIARGVLRFLANRQGSKVDPWNAEEPGKILHEVRAGEMARLGEIPFQLYYGSIDSTPLFVVLLACTTFWTGDIALFRELEPNLARALEWMEKYGDRDGDGLFEYAGPDSRPGEQYRKGLRNQGWKDSPTAVLCDDGTPADPPVALVEVQAYAYLAYERASCVYRALGELERANDLERHAAQLRDRFHRAYYDPQTRFYALALTGAKRRVTAIASNPAHALWAGIVPVADARFVAERLLQPDLFSGWGIRTLAVGQPGYNPMSYHNGSVWPFDNSIAAAGLKRYGFDEAAHRVIEGVVDASIHFEAQRLPEVYCGFSRDESQLLSAMPGSCSPQAWSAGAAFLFVATLLGIEPDGLRRRVRFRPTLPPRLGELRCSNLRVAGGVLDVVCERKGGRVVLEATRNPDSLEIEVN
ncbi:MAG: amylo-alpha-1,6-glucosidase [Planctomycetes bacterium]|nr:amylo-alpha-1,6-glucosidase [Planctomycetota bacterium]